SVLILGERLTDDGVNAGANVTSFFSERRGIGLAVLNEHFRRRSRKRSLSDQHLVGDHSQAVNVRTLVEFFSPALLGRHVLRRSHYRTETAHLLGGIIQSQSLFFRDREWLMADRRFAEFRPGVKIIQREDVLQAGDAEIKNLDIASVRALSFQPDVL